MSAAWPGCDDVTAWWVVQLLLLDDLAARLLASLEGIAAAMGIDVDAIDADPDCAECEDYDFVCDGYGCGFCLDHASAHTVEECEQSRTALEQERPGR